MKRSLAPSFVVTTYALSTLGCHNPSPMPNPPEPTVTTASPTAALAKRKRSAPAPARDASSYVSGWDWATTQSLNPKDGAGHAIYVDANDGCYFEAPMDPMPDRSKMPTGSRAVEPHAIDCPAAMNDAAWDTCSSSDLLRSTTSGACVCSPMAGNPPPPPTKNACPQAPK
jgi:hypothetical protein